MKKIFVVLLLLLFVSCSGTTIVSTDKANWKKAESEFEKLGFKIVIMYKYFGNDQHSLIEQSTSSIEGELVFTPDVGFWAEGYAYILRKAERD